MQFTEAIEMYLVSRASDGFAANTVRNDRKSLEQMAYIIGDVPIGQFTAEAFDKIMTHESDRGLSAGSLNMLISTGRAFTHWCHQRGYMPPTQNPAKRRFRKEPTKVHDYLPIDQFPALLDSSANSRDRILLAMGLFTLARSNEITKMRIKDVDLSGGNLSMTISKTYDADLVPISNELDREMRRWLVAYADECGPLDPDWYLIPGSKPSGFQQVTWTPNRTITRPEDAVKRALKPLNWSFRERTGMHLLRRSSARAMFDELVSMGYDGALRRVQTWLHHANMSQTEKYIGLSLDRESRNKDTRGRDMFPSLNSGNVVNLDRVSRVSTAV